jgi:iron-sulfur cluster assembly accessory protein
METTSDVLQISERAAAKARTLAEREGRADAYLRVRVTAGGCSGFAYRLGFEDAPAEEDRVIEGYGLRVLVDPQSIPIIQGSTLDFEDALLGGGFKVLNPQAQHECSCGESFSV